jgi:hypothetical protein
MRVLRQNCLKTRMENAYSAYSAAARRSNPNFCATLAP